VAPDGAPAARTKEHGGVDWRQDPRQPAQDDMTLNRKLIEHLERLARIDLADDEKKILSDQLARIVQFVEKVQSVDTSGVDASPLAGHIDAEHVRDDEPTAGLDRDLALDQAPDAADGFFRVPPVIDRGNDG
jgi:aspartyl-tRNA(Asn)/glutamyl-tRNA(Gln) amidotransferase subunit C